MEKSVASLDLYDVMALLERRLFCHFRHLFDIAVVFLWSITAATLLERIE
jgi:hypothetical protein